ncbi:MAG: cupin domain-containing protein [Candidatus Dormibacterales bacterium]
MSVSKDRAQVTSRGETYEAKQGIAFFAGVSSETSGATGLCMHLLEIPPGGRAHAHRHESHETAIYVIGGAAIVYSGPGLRFRQLAKAGDFVYIPAGVPHLPVNASQTEKCTGIVARTDPNEQESVVLMPELDALAHVVELRA